MKSRPLEVVKFSKYKCFPFRIISILIWEPWKDVIDLLGKLKEIDKHTKII